MYIKKAYILIAVGILLAMFGGANIHLYEHVLDNGGSVFEYQIKGQVDHDDLKDLIEDSFELDRLSIESENSNLRIEMDYLEANDFKKVQTMIEETYKDDLQHRSSSLYSRVNLSVTYILLLGLIGLSLIGGILLVVLGIVKLSKEKSKTPT